VDINEERLKLAKELGATHIFKAEQNSLKEDILHIVPHGVKFVFESSASVAGLNNAINCIGHGGRIGIVSYPDDGKKFPFTTKDLFLKVGSIESIIQGSSIPKTFLPKLLELQKKGLFPYEKLIRTYSFSDINQAIHDVHTGKVIKPVLLMK
jgi:aryl-alcohol dehydrogenase